MTLDSRQFKQVQELSDLNFSSKDEYFEWRDEWKSIYHELSNDIRSCKRVMRIKHDPNLERSGCQSDREVGRKRARSMMEMLDKAKEKSWDQKKLSLAQLELVAA